MGYKDIDGKKLEVAKLRSEKITYLTEEAYRAVSSLAVSKFNSDSIGWLKMSISGGTTF